MAEDMIKEAEEADAFEEGGLEVKRGGIREEDFKRLKEEIERVKEALKGSNQRAVSLRDKDSRFMRHSGGHGIHLSYNGQLSVDDKGIIVGAEVVDKPADDGELLKEGVEVVERNTGKKVGKAVGDNGYYETNTYVWGSWDKKI